VDGGGEHGGFEDAGEIEPLAAHPDAFGGVDAVDAEQLGGAMTTQLISLFEEDQVRERHAARKRGS